MSIAVGQYSFEGPYTNTDSLEDRSGIYAILCYRDLRYYLVDVGETATVKSRVNNHDRSGCWTRNCGGTLTVSVLYTPGLQQAGRCEIERNIRSQFSPACGVI
jgi:hypothetical protein